MIGRPRIHHRVTDSTNERAKQLAAGGAPHGTLVTADEQSAGRGRQGRTWSAAPGEALLLSLVLRSLDELLPFRAAVAVAATIPLPAQIKWPNDVWVEGRKISGILVEGRPQEGWAVLGIGLNVSTRSFPDELSEIATSLALAGVSLSREEVLEALLGCLVETGVSAAGFEAGSDQSGIAAVRAGRRFADGAPALDHRPADRRRELLGLIGAQGAAGVSL